MATFQTQIDKAIEHLQKEFASLQTGRANTALVEDIEVESYGAMVPLKTVANISCPDPKTIKIEPWDKTIIGPIEKAVQEANIGINPQNMGDHLFLPVPPMTEERRRDLVKLVHEFGEKAKISVRNARHDEMHDIKELKEAGEISEDAQKDMETQTQEATDKANKRIEEIAKNKEQDIMSI